MPPLASAVGGFFSGLGDWLQGKTSQEQSQEDDEQNITPTDQLNNRKRKTSSRAERPTSRANKKQRQDTRGAHEKRLLGDYSAGPNAVRISIPGVVAALDGSEDPEVEEVHEIERHRGEGKMSRSKLGGGFKPVNTLGKGSPHVGNGAGGPAAKGAFAKGMTQAALDREIPRFKDDRAARKNTDRPQRGFGAGVSGDGFTGRERGQPTAKKRKIERGLEVPGDRIEVSDDDEPSQVKVMSVNGKAVKPKAQAARTQGMLDRSTSKPFEGNEHKTMDDRLRTHQQKAKRKSANGNRSSQASSTGASPAVAPNGYSSHDVVDLVDDDSTLELTQTRARLKARLSGGSQELPNPSAIGDHLDDCPTRRTVQQRQSGDSVEFVSTNSRAQMAASATHPEQEQAQQRVRRQIRQAGDGAEPPMEQRERRCIPQNDDKLTERYKEDKERRRSIEKADNENLRAKFVRDDATSNKLLNGSTTLRSRMENQTDRDGGVRAQPVGGSSDQEDELNGPRTVGSLSPEKARPQGVERGVQMKGDRKTRSPSASDLLPTQFTHSRFEEKRSTGRTVGKRKKAEEHDERYEIPLANFYATSRVLPQGDIKLRYDEGLNELDVYYNGDLQTVTGEKCSVHISKREISSIIWSRESNFILLRGPSDPQGVSNGQICFTLQDADDMSWLSNCITAIAGEHITWKAPETAERMKTLFKNRAKDLFMAAEKRQRTFVENEKAALAQQGNRRSPDPEQIRYQSEEPAKPNRRKGMRGEQIVDNPAQSGKSPYFQESTVRRSTRQSLPAKRLSPSPPPAPPRWTQIHKPPRWPHSVVYPSTAPRVIVDYKDLERLDEGEFLNDNVISFALQRVEENMAPGLKDRVHFFNSFFYTAVTTNNGKKAFNYEKVKRWTKSRDLLACDYVVVPINIDFHWFVAIICNLPNLSRRAAGLEEDETEQPADGAAAAENDQSLFSSDPVVPSGAAEAGASTRNTPDNSQAMRNLSISDDEATSKTHQTADGDDAANPSQRQTQDTVESPVTNGKATAATGRRSKKRGPPSYNPDSPAIITLDSFGSAHTAEIRYLKQYICAEAESKRSMSVAPTDIQGVNAKGIPFQSNFCDCGAYLVGYVEKFARDPQAFVTKVLTRSLDKDADFADFDASKKRKEIRDELLEAQRVQEAEHKAKKAEKKSLAAKKEEKEEGAASAPATPKQKSKAASNAASPAKHALGNAKQDLQTKSKTSWAPADTIATPAHEHAEGSQDIDMEVSIPRAFGVDSHRAGAEAAVLQSEDAGEDAGEGDEWDEMLDEPEDHPGTTDQVEDQEPNPLLDNLAQKMQGTQQTQAQDQAHFLDGLLDAAAEVPSEQDAGQQRQRKGRRESGPETGVIGLGVEEDEVSAEIPDSQEQEQEQRQQRLKWEKQWKGKRIVFDS